MACRVPAAATPSAPENRWRVFPTLCDVRSVTCDVWNAGQRSRLSRTCGFEGCSSNHTVMNAAGVDTRADDPPSMLLFLLSRSAIVSPPLPFLPLLSHSPPTTAPRHQLARAALTLAATTPRRGGGMTLQGGRVVLTGRRTTADGASSRRTNAAVRTRHVVCGR
jgi:hypothetical protein